MMKSFDFHPRPRLVFGDGAINRLGELARELDFHRTLLVADRGVRACGYVERASRILYQAGIEVVTFHDFDANPDTEMVEAGRAFAASHKIDSIIGLGGGSSMDCAKGINFLLTNGGVMQDYWGFGKASKPMLPMIGIPTTSGTGSEAQSYALISDAKTHVKMACGDPQAAFKIALLDPRLTMSQPRKVAAVAGFDAMAHAIEAYVTTKGNVLSEMYACEAWRLLEMNYERVLDDPANIEARSAMQLGAYFAGVAIENSMLGAAHACANPLTTHYGTPHGEAIAILLPHVVRWNSDVAAVRYGILYEPVLPSIDDPDDPGECLARRLEHLAQIGELPRKLSAIGVPRSDLKMLAEEAAAQWTGGFNPRRWDAAGALEVYECAF